ncbi:hypothetical protein BO82DRAFT_402780 [Aspergillus uvarum CBS 121591]|uniref:Major facilitator superfamily (MFS) profile domain-containing protein n=1 Tax=Aspergillus uvarum CBS 121591 TaxID=1448315 RepID=A0A319C5T4_9EURO|nr:hypothetical protein BO82DRAFT_402780 [Aspergillus uvarum CBS 121591]PYH81206.1 hypothetical protein BO82DRAFT_402780 [Aspergillus uvarum CBS 121591]
MDAAGSGLDKSAFQEVAKAAQKPYIWLAISNGSGWAVFSMLLGQTAGVIFSGPFSERYGRKLVILLAAILYTIGAILMAANFGSFA